MPYKIAVRRMIEEHLRRRGIRDLRLLNVMSSLPRDHFVDSALSSQAYNDHPLNIGCGQTISQPYIVALMTETLQLEGHETVLEIGTGSGYQTAILASLVKKVYSIERVRQLSNKARKILHELGYSNVTLRIGDGTQGWPEAAPFDAILVTASSPQIPQPLVDQLKEGGHIVVPIGEGEMQDLLVVTKEKAGLRQESLGDCRFVKLYGEHGWRENG